MRCMLLPRSPSIKRECLIRCRTSLGCSTEFIPEEVRHVLLLRRQDPEAYKSLPKAGATECLSTEEIEGATELAKKLTPELLNAFFFSHRTGSA